MDIIKSPQETVNSYLYNDFNIEIYNDLTLNETSLELYDPLIFFNLLYSELTFFIANQANYIVVKNHFKERYTLVVREPRSNYVYHLEDQRKIFFLQRFDALLTQWPSLNKENEAVCNSLIKFIREHYSEMILSTISDEDEDEDEDLLYSNFDSTKKIIEMIPDKIRRIEILLILKYSYLQSGKLMAKNILDGNCAYDKQCELEIMKLKEILVLESQKSKPKIPQQVEKINADMVNLHPEFDPNLWSKNCFELFKYLFDNYYKTANRQLTNIWFFLKEHSSGTYLLMATKDDYRDFLVKNYQKSITNFDKAGNKWIEKELPTLREHRINFEDSLK